MPRLQTVVEVLETLYPLRYAEEWDNPGLIVGNVDDEIHTIAFAVDPTQEVIEDALAHRADLIVCHHPLLFRATHTVAATDVHGGIVSMLYRHHCALWVGHTNADVAYRGVGQAVADAFGLQQQKPLVPIEHTDSEHQIGLGRIGTLEDSVTLREFARRVASVLPHTESGVQISGDLESLVTKIAILPGSGDSHFDDVLASQADVYVTSDLRHHPVTDVIEQARYSARIGSRLVDTDHTRIATFSTRQHIVRPALINTPHSAIESLWFNYALDDVREAVKQRTDKDITTYQIPLNTDPWVWHIA